MKNAIMPLVRHASAGLERALAAEPPAPQESEEVIVARLRERVRNLPAPTAAETKEFFRLLREPELRDEVLASYCDFEDDVELTPVFSTASEVVLIQQELRERCQAIDDAVEQLSADPVEHCEKAQALGYPEVSAWLKFPDTNSLETVAGAGKTPRDFHCLRRGIPDDASLHDIVVDVVKKGRAERLLDGCHDRRYDPYVWRVHNHTDFLDRLFVPLMVPRDSFGTLREHGCRWSPLPSDKPTSQLWAATVDDPSLKVEAIGALSLGSTNRRDSAVGEVLELSTSIASSLFGMTLQGVIERMLVQLREASRAGAASIHFVPDGNALQYFQRSVEERGDKLDLHYVARCNTQPRKEGDRKPGVLGGPPRAGGLGVEALETGRSKHLHADALRLRNPGLWDDGVRAMSAYPLRTSSGDSVGIVYLHQFDPTDDLRTGWEIEFLVDRVAHALTQAARELRQRRKTQDRAAVNHIMERFLISRPPEFTDSRRLLDSFAAALASFVGADMVRIRSTGGHVASAGRYRFTQDTRTGHSPVAAVLYSQAGTALPRRFRLPMMVDRETLGSVDLGYAQGNSCPDEELIRKLVDIGAFALQLSYVGGNQGALAEFLQRV